MYSNRKIFDKLFLILERFFKDKNLHSIYVITFILNIFIITMLFFITSYLVKLILIFTLVIFFGAQFYIYNVLFRLGYKNYSELEKNFDVLTKRNKDLRERYSNLEHRFDEVNNKFSKGEELYNVLYKDFDRLNNHFKNVVNNLSDLVDEYGVLKDKYVHLESQYHYIFDKYLSLKTEYEELLLNIKGNDVEEDIEDIEDIEDNIPILEVEDFEPKFKYGIKPKKIYRVRKGKIIIDEDDYCGIDIGDLDKSYLNISDILDVIDNIKKV